MPNLDFKFLVLILLMPSFVYAQDDCNAGTLLYSKRQDTIYILIAEDRNWSSMGGKCSGDKSIDAAARETYEETRESYLRENLRKALDEDRSYYYNNFKTYIVQAEWAQKDEISERPLSEENKDDRFFNEKKEHVWIPYTTLKNVIDGEDLSIKNFLDSEGRQSDNPTLLKNFAIGLKDNLALVDSILTLDNPNSLIVKFNEKADFTVPRLNGHTNSSTSGQSSVQTTGQIPPHQNDVFQGSGDVSNNSTGLDIKLSKKVATTDETEKEDTFTVALTAKPTSNVVIDISEEDDEGAICPKQLTFTPANWNKPQVVTVTGIDDGKIDGDINYPISFLINGEKSADQVKVKNKDDDVLPNIFYLNFNKEGQLLGSMDGHLSEDYFVGQIQISKAEYAKEVEDVLKEYLSALQSLKSNSKLYDALGIGKTDRIEIRANLLSLIKDFLESYGAYLDKAYYINLLQNDRIVYESIKKQPDSTFKYPRPEELLLNATSYQLELFFYDNNGIPINEGKKICGNCKDHRVVLDFINKCGSDCGKNLHQLTTKEIIIPGGASSFEFLLRKKNTRFEQVKKSMKDAPISSVLAYDTLYKNNWLYLDSFYKKAKGYNPKVSDADLKENMIEWASILNPDNNPEGKSNRLYQALKLCYGRNDSDAAALDKNVLQSPNKSIMKYVKPFQAAQKAWIIHWLWLNKGVPHVNPLAAYFNGSPTSVTKLENELEALKAERVFLNKFIESENLSMDDFSKNYQTEKAKVQKLTKDILEKEQAIAKIKAGNVEVAAKADLSRDNLLYKGLLKPNSSSQENYQRNHDALVDYQLVGTYRNEITEIERMHVLIHNLTNKDKVDITFTNEAVDNNQSSFEDELLEFFTESGVTLKNPKDEEMLPCNKEFIIKTYKEQVLVLTKWMENRTIMRIPPIGTRDATPDYFSKEWKHTVPNVFAAHVNYNITEGEGDSKTTEFEGRYRMNKLYRFRLKAGLVNSWLKYEDYTIDASTGEVTSDIERYRLTATTGVQIFWKRFDIRKPKVKFLDLDGMFTYVGLGLREEPFQNWLIGVGKEITSGVGIMGGVHIGTTEKLDLSGGVITVEENRLNYGGFASVIIDLSVFKSFFSLRNIDNPIKGK